MPVKILKHGNQLESTHRCPECKSTAIMVAVTDNKHVCNICSCEWINIEGNNPKICESCGKDVDKRCDDCGWVWGRRGWRQLGTYDG